MWRQHWQLSGDPFLGANTPFVGTATHAEALARLLSTVEENQRLAVLQGADGLGKSTVLGALVRRIRTPMRRVARVNGPVDGSEMFKKLATGLGMRVSPVMDRASAWRAIGDAVRLCRWQRQQVVLVVDDAQTLDTSSARHDLQRLTKIETDPEFPISVIVASRPIAEDEAVVLGSSDWLLAIRLLPLTRSETVQYLGEKLIAAGRADPAFTPRAMSRLHDLSEGVPRGLDRLASLALMAGASRRLELITPDVIDGISARECVRLDPWEGNAA